MTSRAEAGEVRSFLDLSYHDPAPLGAPTRPVGRTAFYHDGFYMRVGLGMGALDVQAVDGNGDRQAALGGIDRVFGGAGSVELSVGGTPVRGVAVGGFVTVQNLALVDFEQTPQSFIPGAYSLMVLGASGDLFPWPASGFHVGASLGFAASAREIEALGETAIKGTGFGLLPQVGYDFWLTEQWSFGLMARFLIAAVTREQATDVLDADLDRLAGGTLVFSAIYH